MELLTTITILSVLAALALPQFRELHERWQVMHAARAMESTLMLARSEAIQRGGNIGLRKIDNVNNGCQTATAAGEWGCGWFIYEDVDANGSWTPKTDRLLHEVRFSAPLRIHSAPTDNNLVFNRFGMAALNALRFNFCPARSNASSAAEQVITMSSGGRIRLNQGSQCA